MKVSVTDGKDGLEKALRQFSRMVKREELIKEIRKREYFLKPSEYKVVKRQEALRRRKRDEKKDARNNKLYSK